MFPEVRQPANHTQRWLLVVPTLRRSGLTHSLLAPGVMLSPGSITSAGFRVQCRLSVRSSIPGMGQT